ncbi:MAG TPA: DUF6515 family protein, partial [Syntrophales bacterium]|nr:DUF6515 family protein [Syntrophales bacterium]
VLMGFPVLMKQAEAWRGYSGGSFRSDEGVVVGPGGGAAVRAPGGGYVAALPDGATRVLVGGRSYYVAGGLYYQPCYVGADVNYCVVVAPSDDGDDDDGNDGDDDDDDGDDND